MFNLKQDIMGGEGAMMAAINSLKGNRSMLSKRKESSPLEGSYANVKMKVFPKATAKQLETIKEKTILENRQLLIKQLVVFVLIVIGLLAFFTNYM